jgi:uncharacterized membrane protein YfcA
MAVVAVIGLLVGIKVRHKIAPEIYRVLLKILLCSLAATLLFQTYPFHFG